MNLITFTGYVHEIPIFLGMFNRNELEYQSKFDQSDFDSNPKQVYYHRGLDTKIIFFKDENYYLSISNDFFNSFEKVIFVHSNTERNNLIKKTNLLKNSKVVFLWHFGEVFDKNFISKVVDDKNDLIYSGSKRPELETYENFYLDLQLPFRYFRYYIGYYWLEEFINNIIIPKYNPNLPKLFSYVRAHGASSWRNEFMNNIHGISELLIKKDSAADAYDLLFPKYKHFETINDYLYCNFNLIFETINFANKDEFFLTEKTFKGLFFGKPFLLVAPYPILNYLKDNGYYILNFEFKEKIENTKDVNTSIQNAVDWLKNTNDSEIESNYNRFLENSKNNRKILFDYLTDYSKSEKIFKKLLNE